MNPIYIEAVGVLVLILMVGFFSAAEVAVFTTRKSRMRELADEGNARASVVLGFQKNPEQFLATVHLGVVFSLILASGLGGIMGVTHLAPALTESDTVWIREWSSFLSLGIMAISIASIVVVLGELVPKSLALRFAEQTALRVATPIRIFAVVFRYPVWLLTFASNVFLAPFRDRASFTESRISEEEFKLMLEEGTKSGVIDTTEHELIKSIFEFSDTTAKEVMIPRPDVVALNINTPREQLIRIVLEEGYSRMPVYQGTIDTVKGIVYTKDLLGMLEHRNLIIIEDVIRPALFVPETAKISSLLRDLRQRRMHMAIVIDEFGGTEGIVTLEDILEEIVGEIHDEYDEELKEVESAADGSYLVNARMSIFDFNQRFGSAIPETDEYDTVGGFLQKIAGGIPDVNEELTHQGLSFSVIKKSQRRIRQVRLRKIRTDASSFAPSADSHPPDETK
jgi:putative hemolysin